MKILTAAIIIAISFTACNPKTDTETKKELVADTTSSYNNSVLTDTGTVSHAESVPTPPLNAATTINKTTVSKKTTKRATTVPVTNTPATETITSTTVTTQPATTTETAPVATEEKKGWSNAAKGAAIGAGAGAIGGAVISKKKGKGAVIGGVLGAAGGYIIGKNKDKKDTAR